MGQLSVQLIHLSRKRAPEEALHGDYGWLCLSQHYVAASLDSIWVGSWYQISAAV